MNKHSSYELENIKISLPNNDKDKGYKKKFLKFHGFILGIVSAIFLSLSNIFMKAARITTGSEQVFVRYSVQAIVMGSIILWTKKTFFGPKESWKLLNLRGCLGAISLTALHFSVKLINPSDAGALINLHTVFVCFVARMILKEKINLAQVTSLIMSIFDVMLIAQPSFIFGPKIAELDRNESHVSNNNFSKISNTQFFLGISLGI